MSSSLEAAIALAQLLNSGQLQGPSVKEAAEILMNNRLVGAITQTHELGSSFNPQVIIPSVEVVAPLQVPSTYTETLDYVQSAETPQDSVYRVINLYNDPSMSEICERFNFDGGGILTLTEGQTAILATDWQGEAPVGVEPIQTDGGYGTWRIDGPWNGEVPAGVALVFTENDSGGLGVLIFLPAIMHEISLPENQLISEVQTAESPEAAVDQVIAVFNMAADENRHNFAEDPSYTLPDDRYAIIATDWHGAPPASAHPLNATSEGGYGVFFIQGPYEIETDNGVLVTFSSVEEQE